jgi:hypothetical protein
MKRLPRPFLILFAAAGVLLLSFTGLFGLVYFKIRDVKEPLINTLQQYIDGELKIEAADVAFFPPGINLKGVKLFAPNDPEPAAIIPEARLRFNLMPLIQRKIETRLTLKEPVIHVKKIRRGKSNMERIFSPLMAGDGEGQKKSQVMNLEELWWRRLAIEELNIEMAHFLSSEAGSGVVTELKNIDIQADRIRFESSTRPAEIKIRYELPQFSKAPMELKTKMRFMEAEQAMKLEDGQIRWGPLEVALQGKALLPSEKNKEVQLDLHLEAKNQELQDLNKVLKEKVPVTGKVNLKGTITGTPFAPQFALSADSPDLTVKGKSLNAFHAEFKNKEGSIRFGPVPLPSVNMKDKIRIAEVLAAGTQLGDMVNVGMLSNSANVIGTQVDQIRANVSIAGGNISLHPFSLGNGHFSASGNGQIIQQKNISAGGTFTLNQGVTRQLIPDPALRRMVTDGRDQISFPFSLSGPLSDPNVAIDNSGFKGKMAGATALILQRQLMGGGINPQNILNAALGNPTTQNQTTTRQTKTTNTTTTKKRQGTTGNSLADQLLFGR